MPYETIIYEVRGHVRIITLNRPHRLNALNGTMRRELCRAWREFEEDGEARVAVVTGAGRAMCTGLDLTDALEKQADGEDFYKLTSDPIEASPTFRWGPRRNNVSKPVIGAINGLCIGGGLDFATEPDVVICSDDAEFFDSRVSVGFMSGHSVIQMARRIPFGQVLRLALMGSQERMSAQRAYEVGLVSQVVPLAELMPTATELAEKMAKNAPLALRGTKLALWKSLGMPLDDAEMMGEYFIRQVVATEDHAETLRAIAEKRPPQWKGR
ncbi:MAG: enoyl-CoA hydratase/isomerase family protein [Chloroflexi bacterium]|nr:enoyl-CoA hydratase/isomerase family protein [Chloroflexota bacterium]